MKKLFTKLFLAYLIVIVVLTSLILIFSFQTIKKNYIQTLTSDLKKVDKALIPNVLEYYTNDEIIKIQSFIKKFGMQSDIRITIIDSLGIVLADSEKDPAYMENHLTRIEIMKALEKGFGSSIRHSHTLNKDMLYVALPIIKNGRTILISRVSLFVDHIDKLYSEMRNKILLIAMIVIFFSIIIIYFVSKSLTKPINELSTAAKKVSQGNFDINVLTKSKGELKELADSFNEMTSKIHKLFKEGNQQNIQLKSILSSMQEGLILIDKDDKINISNKSFNKIVDLDDVKNNIYWEILRDIKLNKLVSSVRKNKKSKTSEILIGESYYMCSANYIETKDEIVLIFYDISEKKQLEILKKDFVVNISHELRTPLTSIKGFIETLEQEKDPALMDRYLKIIKRNTDRLIGIVKDLLIISELEEENIDIEFSDVNIKEIIENSVIIFEQKINEKNLELILNISDNIPLIKADPFKLEQVFINLIANAIYYTKKGAITINADIENNKIKIEVIDTGIGIPKEYQSRIFDRFFKINKSSSKDSTGLGLAIVKHVVKLHKGEITVESQQRKGTKFTIYLPQDNII